MTAITATVIADSTTHNAQRITTMAVVFPRFILPELLTHRMFSRSTASSRAIPARHMRTLAVAEPLEWGVNMSGMSAEECLGGTRLRAAKAIWKAHRAFSVMCSWAMAKLGLHKQITNRLIEPHIMCTMLITATDWSDFFAQRLGEGVQPEMRKLANAMLMALMSSNPRFLQPSEWHLPYVTDLEKAEFPLEIQKLVSVARCARVSYLRHGDDNSFDVHRNVEKDLKTAYKLLRPKSGPFHASPFEHLAKPAAVMSTTSAYYNLRGFMSMRFELDNMWRKNIDAYWKHVQHLGCSYEQVLPC